MEKNQLLQHIIANQFEKGDDFLGSFLPFIEYCLYTNIPEIITAVNLREIAEREYSFGLTLSNYEEILERFVTLNKLYVLDLGDTGGCYAPARGFLSHDYTKKGQEFRQAAQTIADEFACYAKRDFDKLFSISEAKSVVFKFLIKNIDLFLYPDTHRLSENTPKDDEDLLVALFSIKIFDENTETLSALKLLINACVCYHYVYFEQSGDNSDLSNLSVFFDAPLVLYALGYSGKIRKIIADEIIAQLRNQKAKIYCFEHSITEIIGILDATDRLITGSYPGTRAIRQTVEYFSSLDNPRTRIAEAARLIKENIERDTSIEIFSESLYSRADKDYFLDEAKLGQAITEAYGESEIQESAYTDAKSINLASYLRKGNRPTILAQANAIFVTQNKTLTNVAFKFLNHTQYDIPVVYHYSNLSTLLFACSENVAPELPMAIILEKCYAALAPNTSDLDRYIKELHKSLEAGEIDAVDFLHFRSLRTLSELLVRHAVTKSSTMPLSLDEAKKLFEERNKKIIERQIQDVKSEAEEREKRLLERIVKLEDVTKAAEENAAKQIQEVSRISENAKQQVVNIKDTFMEVEKTRIERNIRRVAFCILIIAIAFLFLPILPIQISNLWYVKVINIIIGFICLIETLIPRTTAKIKNKIINNRIKKIEQRIEAATKGKC